MSRIRRVVFVLVVMFALPTMANQVGPFDASCGGAVDGTNEKVAQARQVLSAYLDINIPLQSMAIVRERPDPEFPPRRTGDLRYAIWSGPVTPIPPGPLAGSRLHWGVSLENPTSVLIIVANDPTAVATASPDISLYVPRTEVEAVARHILFEQIGQLSSEIKIEGLERGPCWSLRTKSYRGYKQAVEFAERAPKSLVKAVDIGRHL